MRAIPLLLLVVLPLPAQVGRGTLFHSLSPVQNSGVTQVALPGNPSITTNEVVAWSQGEPNGSARSIWNAQGLGIMLGDVDGNGFPWDIADIDALAFPPNTTIPNGGQPSIYDLRFSLAADLQNRFGLTVARAGDVLAFDGIGGFRIVHAESALQAAFGTNGRLDLDGLAMLGDGSLLVSFRGGGQGNNIVHPTLGSTGLNVQWQGADVFLVPAPIGSQPAIFAFRTAELAQVVNFYYGGYVLNEVVGVEVQPGTNLINNPNDPFGRWQSGRRPMPLWTVFGDDNVFCWNNQQNPLSTQHNFYALVANNSLNFAGYTTNTGNTRVIMDALAIGDFTLGAGTRATLDVNDLNPPGGSMLTVSVRSAEAAGATFQVAASGSLLSGSGLGLGGAFGFLAMDPADPILQFCLSPPIAPLLVTGAADAAGTAQTVPLVVPNAPGTDLWFQAVGLSGGFPMTTPLHVKVR